MQQSRICPSNFRHEIILVPFGNNLYRNVKFKTKITGYKPDGNSGGAATNMCGIVVHSFSLNRFMRGIAALRITALSIENKGWHGRLQVWGFRAG